MREKQIKDLIAEIQLPVEHPQFFSRVFSLLAKQQSQQGNQKNTTEQIVKEEYEGLSRQLDRSLIQEGCSVRNVLKTRRLAIILIDNDGELRTSLLEEMITLFKTHLYSLGPNRQHDAVRQEHILKVLQLLFHHKDLARLLKKIGRPFSNKPAEQIIRDTLQLPIATPITDAHARRAALSAWMCYLRQNIGSCFATAPAEIVHDEQPERFLADIDELLSTSRLKRTYSGIEYAVPLSISWGGGDLKKPILMYQMSRNKWTPEIWFSPGLLAAFAEVGILDKNEDIKKKIVKVKEWVLELIEKEKKYADYITLSAETIIRYALLKSLKITEKDLKEYESRHHEMKVTSFIMHVPKSSKGRGGIGETCEHFYQQFNQAKNAFKALADNALLKSWEFTLASFAETKADFTRWNLYSSLGLGPQDPGGIGQCLYLILKQKVDECNQKVHDTQYEYEQVYSLLQMVEARIRTAASEQELQWLKAEYQSRRHEFRTLEEMRNDSQTKAKRFAVLFDFLIDRYLGLFRDYFQEVYDADMHDVIAGPFDDSPAGFRLLYKHGRTNTSQWTRIQNPDEFIEALSSFFVTTEPYIASDQALTGLDKEFSEIVTAIVSHVKTQEFLETAFYRMAEAHKAPIIKSPLEHLDKIEKKPWAYTSGGTMNTLISCYYRRDEKPIESTFWVENETALLTVLIDTVKQIPPASAKPFLNNSRLSMLMHSPTHAFLLKPSLFPFKEGWMTDSNTYIWARDNFIAPAQEFINSIHLDEEMMQFLIQQLLEKVPYSFQHNFTKAFDHMYGLKNPCEFREHLVYTMEHNRGLQIHGKIVLAEDEIDSLLYAQLPLFRTDSLEQLLKELLLNLSGIHYETVDYLIDLFKLIPMSIGKSKIIGSKNLQDICKALLSLAAQSTTKAVNYHAYVSETAQKLGLAMPTPMIFADTNWVKDFFGFVVNPGTGQLELWRMDCTGTEGYPMSLWKHWIDGSHRDPKWGIYIKPSEYGQN